MLNTIEFIQNLREKGSSKNLIASPAGLELLLKVYNEANDYKALVEALKSLNYTHPNNPKMKVVLDTKTAFWYQNNLALLERIQNWMLTNPEIELNPIKPFTTQNVNQWVAEASKGLFDQANVPMDQETISLLINVLYFKGSWQKKFLKRNNTKEEFYGEESMLSNITYMHLDRMPILPYFENEIFECIKFPYAKHGLVQQIYLPKRDITVEQMMEHLEENSPDTYEKRKIILKMPKYEVFSSINLLDIAKKMELMDLDKKFFKEFDDSFIDLLLQATLLKVDEKGAEAVAITVARGRKGPPNFVRIKEPVRFFMNHPFFFVIRDEINDIDLFTGIIHTPIQPKEPKQIKANSWSFVKKLTALFR